MPTVKLPCEESIHGGENATAPKVKRSALVRHHPKTHDRISGHACSSDSPHTKADRSWRSSRGPPSSPSSVLVASTKPSACPNWQSRLSSTQPAESPTCPPHPVLPAAAAACWARTNTGNTLVGVVAVVVVVVATSVAAWLCCCCSSGDREDGSTNNSPQLAFRSKVAAAINRSCRGDVTGLLGGGLPWMMAARCPPHRRKVRAIKTLC